MSIEALAMAGVDYLDCYIDISTSSDHIPPYLLANGGTEDEQYRNFYKELDMAIRGLQKDDEKEINFRRSSDHITKEAPPKMNNIITSAKGWTCPIRGSQNDDKGTLKQN